MKSNQPKLGISAFFYDYYDIVSKYLGTISVSQKRRVWGSTHYIFISSSVKRQESEMVERILIFFIILFSTVLSSNLGPYQSVLSSNRLPVSLVEKLSSDEANTIHILTFLGSQSTPIIRQTRNLIANTISTTNENYYFVDCEGTEASQDIFSVSDTVVLFVSHQQLQWGQDEIIAQVEDILEASLHSQKPQSLVFVLEKHDKKSALVRDLQTSIENLVSLKKLHSPNSLLLLPKVSLFLDSVVYCTVLYCMCCLVLC